MAKVKFDAEDFRKDPRSEKSKSKGYLKQIILCALIVAAIIVVICFKNCGKNEGNEPNRGGTGVAQKENIESTNITQTNDSSKVGSTALTPTSTDSVSNSTSQVNGNLEENARQVIRGVFGNGQERKDKLGSAYSEIQGRVNEMYRQGLVH